jgi:hypothetical protein
VPVNRPPRGKKSGNTQKKFKQLLHKQCPWHPKGKHSAWECFNLRKSLKAPMLEENQKKKVKDKADDDQEDKSGGSNFQDASKIINIIFGGDSQLPLQAHSKAHAP